ncbi:TPA: hypothetical protein ACQUHF_004370 [Bacillus paranthracis]
MKITYKEKTFKKYDGKEGHHCILNKEDRKNTVYIANCAALAFHKSLVGISELRSLESIKDHPTAGGLRISRALNTYYSIYHLFVAMMLLDRGFDIKVNPRKDEEGIIDFGVNLQELNNPKETPDAWDAAGKLEQDLATNITHSNVKQYCRYLRRKKDRLSASYKMLYDNFVKVEDNQNKSVKGLFEKICYIRDRAVYRPSIVYSEEGGKIHTSKDIRKEIEGLPSSEELLRMVKEIILLLQVKCKTLEEYKEKKPDPLLIACFGSFSNSYFGEEEQHVRNLGYTDEDIEEFKNINQDALGFQSHITHLMELVNRERLRKDHADIWKELL